jgi:hypothetical protein
VNDGECRLELEREDRDVNLRSRAERAVGRSGRSEHAPGQATPPAKPYDARRSRHGKPFEVLERKKEASLRIAIGTIGSAHFQNGHAGVVEQTRDPPSFVADADHVAGPQWIVSHERRWCTGHSRRKVP